MAFAPEYMSPKRLLNPLTSPYGCHSSEIFFLCGAINMQAEKERGGIIPQAKEFDFDGHKVYAINKNIGDKTWLVINAPDAPYLEAMVINPNFETTIVAYHNVRYLCSGAYYTLHHESSLTRGLDKLKLPFPDEVGLICSTLIRVLNQLSIKIGGSFGANMDEMHLWMKSTHPSVLKNSWPY